MDRRGFVVGGVSLAAVGGARKRALAAPSRSPVVVVAAQDRQDGLRRALALWKDIGVFGRHVVVKPNFNSADPFPGSTHPDTLAALVDWLGTAGASRITVADRSGMGDTRTVIDAIGVAALGRRLGFASQALDAVPPRDWVAHPLAGGHWRRGVLFPRLLEEAEAIVSTCCLKTHRFGGHFTLSLKNSVGAVAKHGPDGYDYMRELHTSPAQREMIAEINQLYRPALVVLDGMEAFIGGGPEAGARVAPGVIVVGQDRVAIDAVGVALLRLFGARGDVAAGPVFRQAQIARAVALGLGAGGADAIDLVTDDGAGRALVARLRDTLQV